MDIIYVDHSIANNFGSYIELNENLKRFPKLHDQILKHELSHTNEKGFTAKDFSLDMDNSISTYQIIRFMFNHPKSVLQFRPFYRSKGIWYYDINMIITWSLFLIIILTTLYFIL